MTKNEPNRSFWHHLTLKKLGVVKMATGHCSQKGNTSLPNDQWAGFFEKKIPVLLEFLEDLARNFSPI